MGDAAGRRVSPSLEQERALGLASDERGHPARVEFDWTSSANRAVVSPRRSCPAGPGPLRGRAGDG